MIEESVFIAYTYLEENSGLFGSMTVKNSRWVLALGFSFCPVSDNSRMSESLSENEHEYYLTQQPSTYSVRNSCGFSLAASLA